MQQEQQQQPQLQPRPSDAPMPAISLAPEVLNVWNVLVKALADAPDIPTVLSFEQLSATVGPVTQLALTLLQSWDGSSAPSSTRRGTSSSIGTLGVDTDTSPGELWAAGIVCQLWCRTTSEMPGARRQTGGRRLPTSAQ